MIPRITGVFTEEGTRSVCGEGARLFRIRTVSEKLYRETLILLRESQSSRKKVGLKGLCSLNVL